MAMSQHDTPTFTGDTGNPHIALSPFDHADRDIAFDPLSTNRQFPDQADLPVLGTIVVAGLTPDSIHVMIPLPGPTGGKGGPHRPTPCHDPATRTGH